jgi:hypothetical protein
MQDKEVCFIVVDFKVLGGILVPRSIACDVKLREEKGRERIWI